MAEERILVVMPNWFGETLFATPFLSSLRRARPSAFIAALGVSRCQEILAHHPHLNACLLYEERGRHRSLAGTRRLIGELRNLRCDTAFLLRRSLTRSLLLAGAGIRRRIGFAQWKSGWLLTDRVVPPVGSMHSSIVASQTAQRTVSRGQSCFRET